VIRPLPIPLRPAPRGVVPAMAAAIRRGQAATVRHAAGAAVSRSMVERRAVLDEIRSALNTN